MCVGGRGGRRVGGRGGRRVLGEGEGGMCWGKGREACVGGRGGRRVCWGKGTEACPAQNVIIIKGSHMLGLLRFS